MTYLVLIGGLGVCVYLCALAVESIRKRKRRK